MQARTIMQIHTNVNAKVIILSTTGVRENMPAKDEMLVNPDKYGSHSSSRKIEKPAIRSPMLLRLEVPIMSSI